MTSVLLRKTIAPTATCALIVAAGYLQALAATRLVGTFLAPSPAGLLAALAPRAANGGRTPDGEGRTGRAPAASTHETSAARLLERNPFDSARGSLMPAAATAGPASTPGPGAPHVAPPCEGVSLLATAAADDASRSFAVLAGGAHAGGVVRRQGDEFAGKRVWFVAGDRVWLIAAATFCQASMGPAPRDEASSASASASAPRDVPAEPALARAVQVGPGSFELPRSAVEGLVRRHDELLRSVRATPVLAGGAAVGLRLRGVRPGSPLAQLGLEEGDVLESVNGLDVADPGSALRAYAHLRDAERLQLKLTRQGRPATLDYRIK